MVVDQIDHVMMYDVSLMGVHDLVIFVVQNYQKFTFPLLNDECMCDSFV